MNQPIKSSLGEIPTIIGTLFAGGYFAGRIQVDGQLYALIVAPKAEGEHKDAEWIAKYKDVPGAKSYNDGLANTDAMAAAGSKVAKWARDLRIDGHDDWYLPSQDELEIMYRNLKPTTDKNWCYYRSGINVSAMPPTYPYTPDFPIQTQAELFIAGGSEAFDDVWYWSSTQHATYSGCAWVQNFGNGGQSGCSKGSNDRARAVRRLPI